MNKKSVYLFQPQDVVRSGDEEYYWLPYSAACIWSYVSQYSDIANSYQLKNILFKRENHNYILDSLDNPCIVGFSFYVWNETYCIFLAKKIKDKWPQCKIIFGGEQSSKKYSELDFVDTCVIAEGEQSFLKILRMLNNNEPLPKVITSPRLDDLTIPSPYLDGTMDLVVNQYPNLTWNTTIETNRGCPYSCTFCDWGGALQAKIKKFSLEKVQAELNWIKNNYVSYLFIADANFGIFKDRDKTIAEMITHIAENGVLEAVNIQYAKNNVDSVFAIGKLLGHYNRGITVSVQSMNPDTLESIKRKNLKLNDIEKIMQLSAEYNVDTYTEVILGLPLETNESWRKGLTDLLELGQHQSIDFGLAEVLENSELNLESYRKQYGLKTRKVNRYYTIDEDEYPEAGEIVYETSTMDLEGIVQSYMYAWMIVHCHIGGYTQLFAKYARYMHNISYRKFYDILFNKLHGNSVICRHFKTVMDKFRLYLQSGNLKDWPEKGDSFHFASFEFCFANKSDIFELGKNVIINLGLDAEEISELQTLQIYDPKIFTLPQTFKIVTSSIDIDKWQKQQSRYKVTNRLEKIKQEDLPTGVAKNYERLNFWFMRRKNLLKNDFEKI